MDRKEEIRLLVRERRAGVSPAWIAESSRRLQERVLALDCVRKARTVACYLHMPREVRTDSIITRCWNTGIGVCVPAFDRAMNKYVWVWCDRDATLETGPLHVPQPVHGRTVASSIIDVFLVPGLAFDRRGGRVGHGRGWYDRLLCAPARSAERPGSRPSTRVGLAFEFQVLPEIPVEKHDVCMDWVVTENESIACASGAG